MKRLSEVLSKTLLVCELCMDEIGAFECPQVR